MRTTITLHDSLYRRLKIRAAETGESLSSLVEDAIKQTLIEDLEDIDAVKSRENEPATDFENFVSELKADGLL